MRDLPKDTKIVKLKLDGSGSHNLEKEKELLKSFRYCGMPMVILKQPTQSPDLNTLDLGYFTSIQGLQNKKPCQKVEDLVENVQTSYMDLSDSKLINVFITLRLVM